MVCENEYSVSEGALLVGSVAGGFGGAFLGIVVSVAFMLPPFPVLMGAAGGVAVVRTAISRRARRKFLRVEGLPQARQLTDK